MFVSNGLTKVKFNDIKSFALVINEHKNLASKKFFSDIPYYVNLSKQEFGKECIADLRKERKTKKKVVKNEVFSEPYPLEYQENDNHKEYTINSNFYIHIYDDVYTCYKNRCDQIISKVFFYSKVKISKDKEIKTESDLQLALTYLARHGNNNSVEYINSILNNTKKVLKKQHREFYESCLHYIDKFGFKRMFELAVQKRVNSLKSKTKLVEFESLSFRGRSRLTDIISHNKNEKSIKSTFISLSWLDNRKPMVIPIKYSKDFFGDISVYHKNSPEYEYVLTFTKNNKVRINICIDSERVIPENKTSYLGADVNVKNNLFSLSNGKTIDYDRKLLNEITEELKRIDELKSKDADYKVGKKKQRFLNAKRRSLHHSQERIIADICKLMVAEGYDHIVVEDLQNTFGKCFAEMDGINYNRIAKELHISSMKDMIEHICRKYDIAFSKVQADYTSKMCSECYCIDDNNRKTQETFCCVRCGHSENADFNASKNILNRVVETVFRPLLKQNPLKNSTFLPDNLLGRKKVKEILFSAFTVKPFVERTGRSCNVQLC